MPLVEILSRGSQCITADVLTCDSFYSPVVQEKKWDTVLEVFDFSKMCGLFLVSISLNEGTESRSRCRSLGSQPAADSQSYSQR